MKNLLIKICATLVLFGGVAVNAQASTASIWLQPAGTTTITLGQTAAFDMYADASHFGGFQGGGLDLFYDSGTLQYNDDFAFDPGFGQDPGFSRVFDNCFTAAATGCGSADELNGMGFGDFGGLASSGPTLVGSFSFTGLGLGLATLTMADNEFPQGSWFEAAGGIAITVDYTGAQVNVVPLPAAAWLMLGGLGMLWKVGRKRGLQESAAA